MGLCLFVAARQQYNNRLALPDEVHAVAGAGLLGQFPATRFALSMIAVMRAALSYPDCAVHNLVNQPVLLINAATPIAGQSL